jgi:hypothetical protein
VRECESIDAPSMLRLMRRAGGLGEDVANLRFDLGAEAALRETRYHDHDCCAQLPATILSRSTAPV